ncbi:hypothetical protein [Gottschalkia acidurici]|nr:hypothetical protein [Gottschalkia acidurici]
MRMIKSLTKYLSLFLIATILTLSVSIDSYASNDTIDSTQTLDLNNSDVTISDPKTLDELAESLSEKSNISKNEAKEMLQNSLETDAISLRTASGTEYREISQTIFVKGKYYVQMVFYCEVNKSGPMVIHRILNYTLDRGYRGGTYGFQGDIYVNLENSKSIYYSINGDFYRNSQLGVEVGGGLGIGESGTLSLKVSGKLDHFAYLYNSDRISW